MINLITPTVFNQLIIFKERLLISYIYIIFNNCMINIKIVTDEMHWTIHNKINLQSYNIQIHCKM